ncbi:MAG: site-specific DNA-methyltransferase [Methyloversatilis sp.]|nr:site-specific DNA-methyltransferase [Methyloversatilis sp.]MBP6195088.1 site-specific DNA-methyltransferase [Methyloversatilis sp.]
MAYEHLRLEREAPINPRHPRRFGGSFKPDDPRAYGVVLGQRLQAAKARIADPAQADIGGFDERKLLKIRLHAGDKSVPPFDAIPGVEIVSQEDESVVLAFATDEGLSEFERRLTALARDGVVTRKELLFAVEDFDHWTPEERKGNALRDHGFPAAATFTLDIELWPQERQDKRQAMVRAFVAWQQELSIEKLDEIQQGDSGDGRDTATACGGRHFRPNQMYKIHTPGGAEHYPPKGRCWVTIESEYQRLLAEGRMWFGSDGRGVPRKKTYLNEQEGRMSWTWWPNDEVGNTQESKKEIISLFGPENVFDTPKPERLVHRILHIATNPGDLVLDSFAGSGTTGAVAHKMGRRWIMVELGEHCHTHVIPRMKKVIDGEDGGGVTEAVEWKGGGGFRYYKLAPSLIVNDRWGNPVINPDYNAAQLAEALAKLEGFSYAPSELQWWQHGHSSERDFIYVTTQNLSAEQLQALSDEVGSDQSLLVCCAAFHGVSAAAAAERWPNLTLKKIPKMVLARCEWGHDDYSLNVANLPMAQPEEAQHAPRPAPGGRGKKAAAMPDLFGDDGEAT